MGSNKASSSKIKSILNMDLSCISIAIKKRISKIAKVKNSFKKNVVAFDIGSAYTKVVEGFYYKGNLVINNVVKIETPIDSVVDGEIKKEDELILKLKKVLTNNNIKAKYAICTTNSTTIINREILIPKVEENELETVVRYEIQQYLPINLDDYEVQITILGEEIVDGLDKLNVRAIVYPKKLAISYYNLLKRLNLKPYALDVNYNALNKLINYISEKRTETFSNDTLGFIDIGDSSIQVNIYKDGVLNFTRMIKAGGKEINQMITNSEDSSVTIENMLIDVESNDIKKQALAIMNQWMDMIEMTLQFYKNKNRGNSAKKLFVFGGYSNIKNIDGYMSDRFGIETKKIGDIPELKFDCEFDKLDLNDFMNVTSAVIRN